MASKNDGTALPTDGDHLRVVLDPESYIRGGAADGESDRESEPIGFTAGSGAGVSAGSSAGPDGGTGGGGGNAGGGRARKPRAPNKKRAGREKVVLDAGFLAQQLQGIHYGIAIIAGNPIWQISDEEAVMLGNAIAHCADAYSISVDPRVVAMGEFIGIAGMIYIPRFLTIRELRTAAAAAASKIDPNLGVH